MPVPTIPTIPPKMGEAGAHQEKLYSILSAMKENIEAGTASSVEIQALQTAVGDETDGLVKDVADLQTAVGDETAGIVKDIDDLQAKVAANQADSTATEVAGLVADFNTLLASLKAAGLMVEDTQG